MATIRISLENGSPQVDVAECRVEKGELVTWKGSSGLRWMVVVEGKSPLSKGGHNGQSPFTGNLRIFENKNDNARIKGSGVSKGSRYKYLVICWDGDEAKVLDPDIVIEDNRDW